MNYEIKVLEHIKWNSSYEDYKALLDSVKDWTLVLFKSPYFKENDWLLFYGNWVIIGDKISESAIDEIKEKYSLAKVNITSFTRIDNYIKFLK